MSEQGGPRDMLRAGSAGVSRRRATLTALGTLCFSATVFVMLWLTAPVSDELRAWQMVLGAVAVLGAVLSRWFPLGGALAAGVATAVGWALGATVDPFILASVGIFAVAERRESRRFPGWLLGAFAGIVVTALVLGSPPDASGFEDRMRWTLLSAIVIAAAWVLGAHTGHARWEAAARARTEERLRLVRDVHDALSHSLGAIGVQAGVAAHVAALREPELRATLRDVESQARSSLRELKSLLQGERSAEPGSETASLPLTSLLRDTARTAERTGLEVELNGMAGVDALPAAIRMTVHRIVQEAVTNAVRHAEASTLRISATVRDTRVEVTVSDDGIGAPAGVRAGHGLTGMRERVALVGGELCVASTPTGLTLTARLPVRVADGKEVRP
ncbi:sensor histidine kinase [Leucobacter chromiireducens]|uniref:sensor histidine kinase n=1 Tax=Leucobacter chromiireducens TaxID=283877 RepID=UPI000F637EFC|nr:sensor histidine kinase [Leucobacter chromiireducens]